MVLHQESIEISSCTYLEMLCSLLYIQTLMKSYFLTIAQKIDNNRTYQIIIINHHSCYDLTKQLSYYLYFFSFLFLFFSYLDLLYKKGIWKSITEQCHMSECYKITLHDEHWKVVYRLCSSCISRVQNLTKTY